MTKHSFFRPPEVYLLFTLRAAGQFSFICLFNRWHFLNVLLKMTMIGFEPWLFGIISDCSANSSSTTTYQLVNNWIWTLILGALQSGAQPLPIQWSMIGFEPWFFGSLPTVSHPLPIQWSMIGFEPWFFGSLHNSSSTTTYPMVNDWIRTLGLWCSANSFTSTTYPMVNDWIQTLVLCCSANSSSTTTYPIVDGKRLKNIC